MMEFVRVARTCRETEEGCAALREALSEPVLGLDCEWRSGGYSRDKRDEETEWQRRSITESTAAHAPVLSSAHLDNQSDQPTTSASSESRGIERGDNGTSDGEVAPVSLLQLATASGHVLLVRLPCLERAPAALIDLLCDSSLVKVGVGIATDVKRLLTSLGVLTTPYLDLRHFCPSSALSQSGRSLKAMAWDFCELELEKNTKVVHSNWDAPQLSEQQIRYAALDAVAGARIFLAAFGELFPDEGPLTPELFTSTVDQWFDMPYKSKSKPRPPSNSSSLSESERAARRAEQKLNTRQPMTAVQGPVYDNHTLQAPDGEVLTRISRRKALWYLGQKLADLVSVTRHTDEGREEVPMDSDKALLLLADRSHAQEFRAVLRLRFEPKARSSGEDAYYATEKANVCVACGTDRDYLRKRVIPPGYVRFFPDVLKSHRPHDVLLLCKRCHVRSNVLDDRFKQRLAEEYDAPLQPPSRPVDGAVRAAVSAARALQRDATEHNLPEQRRVDLRRIVQAHLGTERDEWSPGFVDQVLAQADNREVQDPDFVPHEEKVMRSVAQESRGFEQFEQRWRRHFLDSMRPRFMPALWSVEHNANRRCTSPCEQ